MSQTIHLRIFILFIFSFSVSTVPAVFGTTDVFHSQYCFLGQRGPSTVTIPCTTPTPQANIISTGISYIEHSKPLGTHYRVRLTVSYASDPTTTFNVNLVFQNPVAGMKMGIFIIVIKAQVTDLFIDLINFQWPIGTTLDNYNDVYKSDTKQYDVTQLSIFKGGTSGLDAIPFVSYWEILTTASTTTIEYQIIPTLSGSFLNVQAIFANMNKMEGIGGFVLLFDPAQIPVGISKGWNVAYFTTPFQMGSSFNLNSYASNYGPSFNSKCFIGIWHYKSSIQQTFEFVLGNTALANYSIFQQIRSSAVVEDGNLFCFGNSSMCGQSAGGLTHADPIDKMCYTASTCPLPIFTGWTSTSLCPGCTQLICAKCDVTDRSKCLICNSYSNSHLSGTTCVCDTNYIEVTTPIDTAASGLWNNLTPSLSGCKLNCSAAITGCQLNDCTNSTFCTVCATASNYVLVAVSSSVQNCVLCNVQIPNCKTCTDSSYCSVCEDGWYVLAAATSSSCALCSSVMPHCTNCTDGSTCNICEAGYLVDATTKNCYCNVAFNNLLNCQSCISPDKCDICDPFFYLNSSTFRCQPCSDIHSFCTDCSNQNTCTACSITSNYVIKVPSSSPQTCALCNIQIPYCKTCTDSYFCAVCEDGSYLLTAATSNSCPLCSLIMSHCTNCTDANTCILCQPGYLVDSTTKKCYCNVAFNSMFNCSTCTTPDKCDICDPIFYLNSTTFRCQPCSDIHRNCTDCSNQNTCVSCSAGFTLDSVTTPGSVTCRECGKFIDNCTLCSSSTVCTDCDYFFGLNSSKCNRCDSLLMTGCESCEDASLCLKCDSQTRMIDNFCHYCNEVLNCADCIVSPSNLLWCTVCDPTYFVALSPVTGIPECKPCYSVCSYCKDCSGLNQCTSCESPYALGSSGLCDQCETGFQSIQGYCMKQAGCMSLYIAPDGKEICLACATELNFVFDTKQLKCVCSAGYAELHAVGQLMKCVVICGDGLVQSKDEECDDKNTQNDDGCDSSCKIQQGFNCTTEQPSKCVIVHDIDSFEYGYTLRVMPQNKAAISFTIKPAIKAFKTVKWDKMMKLSFFSDTSVKQSELTYSYSFDTNELLVKVPYYEELENTLLQASLKLDPTIIKSAKRQYFLEGFQLNGKNAPLVFESEASLATYGNINLISQIVVVLLLIQFYVGSYTHKMIGLETIQTIQTIYFSRMIVTSTSTSLLQSMNNIQYAATGYQNADLIFGETVTEKIASESFDTLAAEFSSIKLQKYFLQNINFVLILILVAAVSFLVRTYQKVSKRKKFMEDKKPQIMTEYTEIRRSCQWIYDHLVFPFVMMVNMACFFENILYFTATAPENQSEQSQRLERLSFPFHEIMLLGTLAIYCFEIFVSYEDYKRYRMTEKEKERTPQTEVEKLDHDKNYIDRANYHPLYVLVYSLFYLLLQTSMVFGVMFKDFAYKLELTLGVSTGYFLLICFWKPYHSSVNVHNHFLKLNHGTVVLFLVICQIFLVMKDLPNTFYIYCIYGIMVLLSVVLAGGFVRIWIERMFRKRLEQDNSLLDQIIENGIKKKSTEQETSAQKEIKPLLPKNYGLVAKNRYVFVNQLSEIGKKYGLDEKNRSNLDMLTREEEQYVMEKIREENKRLNKKSLINRMIENSHNFTGTDQIIHDQLNKLSNSYVDDFVVDDTILKNKKVKPSKNEPKTIENQIGKHQSKPTQLEPQNKESEIVEKPLIQNPKQTDRERLLQLKQRMRMELRTAFI